MYLENQSVSDIGLLKFHVHDGVLANESWDTIPVEVQQGWWPHVQPCLASCDKHAIQSGSRPDAASS
jgi:hypothetical protein